jgi:hypothetical protein
LVPFTKLGNFSEAIFNPATEVRILGLRGKELFFSMRMTKLNIERVQFLGDTGGGFQFSDPPAECLKFVPVSLLNVGGSLRQLGIKSCPCALMVVRVLLAEQAKCFLGAELRNSRKLLNPKAIQNFGSLEAAYAHTEGTFDSFVRHW